MSDSDKCPTCGTRPAYWFWIGVISLPVAALCVYIVMHISIGWKGG